MRAPGARVRWEQRQSRCSNCGTVRGREMAPLSPQCHERRRQLDRGRVRLRDEPAPPRTVCADRYDFRRAAVVENQITEPWRYGSPGQHIRSRSYLLDGDAGLLATVEDSVDDRLWCGDRPKGKRRTFGMKDCGVRDEWDAVLAEQPGRFEPNEAAR